MKLEEQFPEAVRFYELLEKEARYDALLAVLRRCVEAMDHMRWGVRDEKCEVAALAAARPYLEHKEEAKT